MLTNWELFRGAFFVGSGLILGGGIGICLFFSIMSIIFGNMALFDKAVNRSKKDQEDKK